MMRGRRRKAAQLLHAATALIGSSALLVQYWLLTSSLGLTMGTWRFLGFFTLFTNMIVAAVAAACWLRPNTWLASPTLRHAALCSIILVGLTYSLTLRGLWAPTGWQKLVDIALHDLIPLLYAVAWLAGPHGGLSLRALSTALIFPFCYLGYAMLRGMIDSWYAYWFLNPTSQSRGDIAISVALLTGALLLIGGTAILIDRLIAAGSRRWHPR